MKIVPVPPFSKSSRLRGHALVTKVACVLLILVFIQLLNQFLIFSGTALERTLSPDAQNSRFVVGVYQQLVQALIGIFLYRWLFKKGIKDLGINTWHKKLSLQFFIGFAWLWLAVVALYVAITYFFFPSTWEAMQTIDLPQTNRIVATLLFQSFFPGLGEEILFRGFFINLLSAFVFAQFAQNRAHRVGIIILSSIYFAIAHIYFTLLPFQITHIDPVQIVMALGCGAFYAYVYLKTGSLLAPFLAHNFANITSTICGYIISGL